MLKKILFLFAILCFLRCSENNLPENCLRASYFSVTKSLTNPEFNQALTVNGTAEIIGGFKGILLINAGLNRFVAYDKICPNNDCSSPMNYDKINSPNILKCSCDNSEYGLGIGIGGAPQTPGFECPAIEYKVVKIGNSIRISNF
ncbi:phosphoribosylaminoimidazole carboxylase [uncultured Polaribacter sp.]|uniref:phosphoribosylaminoimidazole carboxylase n=1 Tax=uncultured Polaribacter sp. TaxID=174711 RepID=UPI000B2A341B|nr:phosphoribosylaminoimidazole carboxylase [Polaribacter sp.]|tara:strand:+ start:700 stop:1134 length:435 start_codon:yes stop_codon:yes gene_type:complete